LQLNKIQIEGLAQILHLHGRSRSIKGTARTADLKSGSSELLGAAGTDKEGDIAPRFEQTSAEIAADSASTDDKDTHGRHPW
jgi:hypothetical protein